ncbi:MAG: hypothetical protein LBE56_12965 [Tannerella sp.]|nr:hypothetical protein [Tannerella sp.]
MIQLMLFEEIRKRLKASQRLSDIVEELLDVKTTGAYLRINGNQELTLSEFMKLCSEYGISVDELMGNKSNRLTFRYHPADLSNLDNYRNYIREITEMISALSGHDNGEIWYSAEDIPLFHFLRFHELAFFKVYIWYNAVSGSKMTFERFVAEIEGKESLYANFNNLGNSYLSIPSSEIWTENTIDHVLRSLQYADGMGAFEKKESLELLFSQLLQIIENAENWAETGKKDNRGDFKLYYSAVNPENNFMLLKNSVGTAVAIRLYAVKNIFTSNPAFCEETGKWIESIMSKSLLLSGSSAKDRIGFFRKQKVKINGFRELMLKESS